MEDNRRGTDGNSTYATRGWGGQELQDADGWVTTSAGESVENMEVPSVAESLDGAGEDALSIKDKKARRDFYTKFTERALARDDDHGSEGDPAVYQDVDVIEHEQIIAWRAWVDLRHRVPDATARLICCPWAGGNSLAFEQWFTQLPGVEVVPLLLPGRLTRANESAMRDLSDIVTAAVDALCGLHLLKHDDIPCFVYGHDFGALVAFEICRKVKAEFPMEALFVSSMTCPQMVHEREKPSLLCQVSADGKILHRKNAEFESAILRTGLPIPAEVRENKDLMEIFTPLWFADLNALDTYEYTSGTLLDCPIFSLGGKMDDEHKMSNWAMESSSGRSETTLFPGGSFFWLDHDTEVEMLRLLRDRCTSEVKEGEDPTTAV
ncbi:unnamed protein product [Scytosiphon promiscuus]